MKHLIIELIPYGIAFTIAFLLFNALTAMVRVHTIFQNKIHVRLNLAGSVLLVILCIAWLLY